MQDEGCGFESHLVHVVLSRQMVLYYQAMRWATELLGGKCVWCGSTENLEFDHIDASTKEIDISKMFRNRAKHTWQAELQKCQLLCRTCHKVKSRVEGNHAGGHNKIENPQHGTAVRYGKLYRCRCDRCRTWKRLYRTGQVDSLGQLRLSSSVVERPAMREVAGSNPA